MNKEEKQKLLWGFLLGCILLALYYYLLIQPKLSRLGELMPKVKERREELAAIKEDIANRDRLDRQIRQLDERVKEYQKVFPPETDLSQLLEYLSGQARASNVSLVGVEPKKGEAVSRGVFREVLLTVQVRGGYHSLGLFLNRLETGERMMAVDHFELSADPQNPMEHPMKLDLKTYASQ